MTSHLLQETPVEPDFAGIPPSWDENFSPSGGSYLEKKKTPVKNCEFFSYLVTILTKNCYFSYKMTIFDTFWKANRELIQKFKAFMLLPGDKITKSFNNNHKNSPRKAFIPNISLLVLWTILTTTFIYVRSLLLSAVCRSNNFKAVIFQSVDNMIYMKKKLFDF